MGTPTIRDVARRAAVSVASASRAINGHSNVTEETRKRVLDAARELDYVPHVGARSLTMRTTNTIGVVLPDLFGEFFSEIIRGIDRVAHQRGLQLLLANMHGDVDEIVAAIRAMRGRVDGLLVMWPNVDGDFLATSLSGGLPTVIMGGKPRATGTVHGTLSVDNFAGARAMVAHLVASGRKRIAHVAGPRGNADAEERINGFRDAMAALLGEENPLILPGDFSEEAGHAAGQLIAQRVGEIDAVFASNDVMAVGCIGALAEAGVAVPDTVAVAGFDDIPIARYVTPALTTMRVHIAELGGRAFETLTEIMADPAHATPAPVVLTPELVVRGSTVT